MRAIIIHKSYFPTAHSFTPVSLWFDFIFLIALWCSFLLLCTEYVGVLKCLNNWNECFKLNCISIWMLGPKTKTQPVQSRSMCLRHYMRETCGFWKPTSFPDALLRVYTISISFHFIQANQMSLFKAVCKTRTLFSKWPKITTQTSSEFNHFIFWAISHFKNDSLLIFSHTVNYWDAREEKKYNSLGFLIVYFVCERLDFCLIFARHTHMLLLLIFFSVYF